MESTDRVERGGGVAHAAAHNVIDGPVLDDGVKHRVPRIEPARSLQTDKAAAARGDADRPAAIGGVRHRHNAGRDGGSRAAARSAGRAVEVPRVAAWAEQFGLGEWHKPHFRHVRFTESDETGCLEALDDGAVHLGHKIGEQPTAAGLGCAGEARSQVFDEERHAGEDAIRAHRIRDAPRLVVQAMHHRVQLGVDAVGSVGGFFEKLRRRDLPPAHKFRKADSIVSAVLRKASHRPLPFLKRLQEYSAARNAIEYGLDGNRRKQDSQNRHHDFLRRYADPLSYSWAASSKRSVNAITVRSATRLEQAFH